MEHRRRGSLIAGLALLLAGGASARAAAETPLLILGLSGGAYLSSVEGAPAEFFPEGRLSAVSSWRGRSAGGAILSLSAASRLYGYWDAGALLHDRENLAFEAQLPFGLFTALLAAGVDGSALGTVEEAPYAQPDWAIGLRTTGEPWRTELRLKGSYLYRPEDAEDALHQGVRLELSYDPSIRWGLLSVLEAGWEYRPEVPALIDAGRHDAVLRAEAGVQGLAGYFLDWNLAGCAGLRLSNTALTGEQSTWQAGGEGRLSWSPQRQIGLQLGGFLLYESWLERQALSSGGVPSGLTLYVVSLGLDGRIDWTPDGRLFLTAEAGAARRLANDPAEQRWSLEAALGIEYSF